MDRKLTTILAADVVGYSAMMERDEAGTFERLRAERKALFEPEIEKRRGRIFKLMGDGLLAEFGSVVDAVECAVSLQRGLAEHNASLPDDQRIRVRIGINLGELIVEGEDRFGEDVNIAARLEQLAEPSGIWVSAKVAREVDKKLTFGFEPMGAQKVKGLAEPVQAFRVIVEGRIGQRPAPHSKFQVAGATLEHLPLPSLAVLPFQNLGSDPEQDYFADGVVEDIITALSRFRSFAVIARNSSFTYKGRSTDVRQVSSELGVRYILEGSLRRAGGRLRIAAQLVDGVSGAHLWADRFEGVTEDVFDFQDHITESVATVVEPHIQAAEIHRSRLERPGSIAVYDIYLRALATGVFTGSLDDNAAAYTLLTEALELEPDNALVLAHAAWALGHRIIMGAPPIGSNDKVLCIEFARKGLKNAAGDAVVMAFCGLALHHVAKDFAWGMEIIQAAISANPNNLWVVNVAGIAHLHSGSVEDALAFFRRASQLSPRDPTAHISLTGVAHCQMILGNYVEALAWATRSLALNQSFAPTYWMLVGANAQLGRMEEARRQLSAFRRVSPNTSIADIVRGQPAADPIRLASILEGLRLAGLEEG
jgi:adenylate cyclase